MFIITCICDDKLIFTQVFKTRERAEAQFIHELTNEENPILNLDNESVEKDAQDYAKSGEYRDSNYSLYITETEQNKDKYLVWNNSDADDSFEVEGKNASDAAINALSDLGWSISAEPVED